MKGRGAMLALALVLVVPLAARADEVGDARARMRTAIGQMDGTAQRIRLLLREARAKHVTSSLACLDESLSRADVSLRRAKEHARAAEDAFSRGNLAEGRFELHQVDALRDGSREASKQADTCAAGKLDFPAPETTTVRVYADRPVTK